MNTLERTFINYYKIYVKNVILLFNIIILNIVILKIIRHKEELII
jgi:hypothetical protein